VAAAAAVVVLLAGGLVVWAQRPGGDQTPVITQPEPVTTTVPQTTPSTLPETSPTTLPPPDAAPVDGFSWQRAELDVKAEVVLNGGDRFVVPVVLDDGVVEEIRSSHDGITWTTRSLAAPEIHSWEIRAVWEDSLLLVTGGGGFSTTEDGPILTLPSTVSIVLPDGTVHERVFDGDVHAAAIGPSGVVLRISAMFNEETIIHNEVGADFASRLLRTELREGDILYAETVDGQTVEIPLADRGYDPGALGRVDGWYSSDGLAWVPVVDFPPVEDVIGTKDGFVGVAGRELWHSENGRSWRSLGVVDFSPAWSSASGLAARWKDGALITDGSAFVYASGRGLEWLPAPTGAIGRSDTAPWPLVATGNVGITYVSARSGEFLFSPDGVSWERNNLPADMADSFGWFTSSAAATDTAVLLLLWDDHGMGGEQDPVWWLGTRP
jgi:hypothetical protein